MLRQFQRMNEAEQKANNSVGVAMKSVGEKQSVVAQAKAENKTMSDYCREVVSRRITANNDDESAGIKITGDRVKKGGMVIFKLTDSQLSKVDRRAKELSTTRSLLCRQMLINELTELNKLTQSEG